MLDVEGRCKTIEEHDALLEFGELEYPFVAYVDGLVAITSAIRNCNGRM